MSIPLPAAQLIHLFELSMQRGDAENLQAEGSAVVRTAAYHIQKLVGPSVESRSLHLEDLIRCIKLLRNLCSFGSPACSALVTAGAVGIIADAIDAISVGKIPMDPILPVSIAQLAANLTTDTARGASAVWTFLFPQRFLTLACTDLIKVHEAVTLALLNCCRCIPGAAQGMGRGGKPSPLLTAILEGDRTFNGRGEYNENLSLFLS